MAIFLDTNVLPWQSSVDSIRFAIVPILAKEVGQEVMIPEIALEEACRLYQQKIEDIFSKYKSIYREVNYYAEIPELILPSSQNLMQTWKASLLSKVKVIPTPEIIFREAIYREIHRKPPAREGRGARDAAIWLTIKHIHNQSVGNGYFVSQNTKDFASNSDGKELHPELRDEIGKTSEAFYYCNSIDVFVDKIATRSELEIKLTIFNDSEIVKTSIRKYIQDNLILRDIFPSLPPGREYIASPIELLAKELRNIHTYKIEDRDVSIVDLAWRANFLVGLLRQTTGGGFSREQIAQELYFDIRIWLRFEKNQQQPAAAEIAFVSLHKIRN